MRKSMQLMTVMSLLMMSSVSMNAQKVIDTSVMEVKYQAEMRTVVGYTKVDGKQILQLGNNISRYYNEAAEYNRLLTDSVMRNDGSLDGMYSTYGKRKRQTEGYNVYKGYPDKGMLSFSRPLGDWFEYSEPMNLMKWKETEGDTIVIGHPCKKAITHWRGRTWTAWYALDIPVSDGPWKLHGLPGLILAAKDLSGDFSYTAFAIEKKISPIIRIDKPHQEVSIKKLNELEKDIKRDYWGTINKIKGREGEIEVLGKDGKPAGKQNLIANLMEPDIDE